MSESRRGARTPESDEQFESRLDAALRGRADERSKVTLDRLLLRTDSDVVQPSVVLAEGRARIIIGELADFVEIAAVSEGRQVPLASFSLFHQLRAFSPKGRPSRKHVFTVGVDNSRSILITIRPVDADGLPAYELEARALRSRSLAYVLERPWEWRTLVVAFATVIIAVCIYLFWVIRKGSSPDLPGQIAQRNAPSPRNENGGVLRTPEPLPTQQPSPSPTFSPTPAVEQIADGALTLKIDDRGAVSGLERLPSDIAGYASSVIADPAKLSIDSRHSPPAKGFTLMNGGTEEEGPGLKSPAGTIVREQRPVFLWRELEGAVSYRLTLRDLSGDVAVTEVSLPSAMTSWKLDRRLPRGRLYGWAVVASKDGKQLRSPSRGFAQFRVLDEPGERLLGQVERAAPGSHLTRGILLYRLGLIAEARQEFAEAARANSGSKTVKALQRRAAGTHQSK